MNKCPFTRYRIHAKDIIESSDDVLDYNNEIVGKVKITHQAINILEHEDSVKYLIAGICKHRSIQGLDPVLIDEEFVLLGYKNHNPPNDFDSKCFETIKCLYNLIGKENRELQFRPSEHFPMGYASPEEFMRIIDQLEDDYFVKYGTKHRLPGGDDAIFMGFKVTSYGKDEAKKGLPKIPMHGLVSQDVETGDLELDNKINHAKNLFLSEPQSMDNMRSACETLSHIIEPLKSELLKLFDSADVRTFFQIVNDFDIRHNKEKTKNLVHPEQLEWVFYSLLNTINTYTKLKAK